MHFTYFLPLFFAGSLGAALPQAAMSGDPCGGGSQPAASSSAPAATAPPSTASSSAAAPYPSTNATGSTGTGGTVPSTPQALAAVISKVAPNSTSCDGASPKLKSQCATADQAAQPFLDSFKTYNISSVNEVAAILSLVAYETGELRYDYHEFPAPTPGACTRSIFGEVSYTAAYAASIPALAANATLIQGAKAGDNSSLDAVCAALTSNPDWDFGAPSWFLSNVCPAYIQAALRTGG